MPDLPRSLKNEEERKRRIDMLRQSHISPLTDFVDHLNSQKQFGDVPYFDPMDGGAKARILFLYEKPGPQADGSGFISRNNNDGTAETTFKFMQQIDLPRVETCIWNTIPGWNGEIKFTSSELKTGFECLYGLFNLLPDLKVIVLVGKQAQKVEKMIALPSRLEVIRSYHPSPKVRAMAPEKWAVIPQEWAKAKQYL